ncbi:MAG: hypothetical protein ONB48_01185 [candidate division KSB1 bacterium]|nr:hypothetical protein [candidate division KSB1 bacterium]MDZ7272709.1 hypothetical protein [candidate division KSB1 bacterium]MDZ7284268.1 hypothetical protein [candidate division KSB1 bacterium]MDZ7297336.1 hypothetical protein [candidate division KSB1 bacterium]MDZ7307045.1 hypothetical protein [candidate division KSB1 bacterium]
MAAARSEDEPAHVEKQYEDVLQNLEAAIIALYRIMPELTDYEVADAVRLLIGGYVAEETERFAPHASLCERGGEVRQAVKAICAWRPGRKMLESAGGEEVPGLQISLNEISACLKRMHQSVQYWTKEGGRQGCLKFVSQFL